MKNDPRGSIWRKWDFHLHSPKSHDYQNRSVTEQDIVDKLIENEIGLAVITDHHLIDIDYIRKLDELGGNRVSFLPGIEFNTELGGKDSVHVVGIFDICADVGRIWDNLRVKLELPKEYVKWEKALDLVMELGGLLTVHGGVRVNSLEAIGNGTVSKQIFKTDFVKKYVDAYDVKKPLDITAYRTKVFPNIGIAVPLISGTDNHNIKHYDYPLPCWIKADCTFLGLKHALAELDRIHLGEKPDHLTHTDRNRTYFIDKIQIGKHAESTIEDKWFSCEIPLNPGYVVIIGNKGSGKSALADIIAHCGHSKVDEFSFLNSERFCKRGDNKASHFEATLTWTDETQVVRRLDEGVSDTQREYVKYIPQSHIETICNSTDEDNDSFERELKVVAYSHIDSTDRLGKDSFDELLNHKVQLIKRDIQNQIRDLNNTIEELAELYDSLHPSIRKNAESRIKECKARHEAHLASIPAGIDKPTDYDAAKQKEIDELLLKRSDLKDNKDALVRSVNALKARLTLINSALSQVDQTYGIALDVASQVQEVQTQLNSIVKIIHENSETTKRFDSVPTTALSVLIDRSQFDSLKEELSEIRSKLTASMTAIDVTAHDKEIDEIDQAIKIRKAEMTDTNRRYTTYLRAVEEWEKTKNVYEADKDVEGSIAFYEQELSKLDGKQDEFDKLIPKCYSVSKMIYEKKQAILNTYSSMYSSVQSHLTLEGISGENIMEFKATFTNAPLTKGLLKFINHSKRGSFLGIETANEMMDKIVSKYDVNHETGVMSTIDEIIDHLTHDRRDDDAAPTRIDEQINREYKPKDVFKYLFSLDYIDVVPSLTWNGKQISQLSPGEKGTLLLLFYMLVDKSNLPLIIDQPEENLDNQTVVQMLVPAFRKIKQKRQLIIVTHNPNLAVVSDADQVIYSKIDKKDGCKVEYLTGAIENPRIIDHIVKVLEGTMPAFVNRGEKYNVGFMP